MITRDWADILEREKDFRDEHPDAPPNAFMVLLALHELGGSANQAELFARVCELAADRARYGKMGKA